MLEDNYAASFDKVFNFTRKLCNLLGTDIIRLDYRFNWRTACVFLTINAGILLCFYTIYSRTIMGGNYNYLFKTSSIIGTGIQGYVKALTFLRKKDDLRFLYTEIKGVYETYQSKSLPYKNALRDSLSLVKKFLGTIFTIVCTTVIILIVLPVFTYVAFNGRLEILPYVMPFVNQDTDVGYLFTSVTHIICVVLAGLGNFISDSWLFVYVAHVPLLKNILKFKFDEFDELVNKYPRDEQKSTGPLMDIFKWHQKYNTFTETIKRTFFWIIFVQISTEFFGIACTIVCMFLGIWPAVPVLAFYLYSLIFSYCALGNLVDSANEDIIVMIYDSCWYNLTAKEQKMIVIMLRESQIASGVSIGGVSPLSLNTLLQITKTIYTFSMMLKNFFN